ncbi:hypothetical protein GE21DRAFT_1217014 [Neurospora crassa]|nr:hypothetical protein GE21DRAFT_1217014 [Neurospora crassa]
MLVRHHDAFRRRRMGELADQVRLQRSICQRPQCREIFYFSASDVSPEFTMSCSLIA